MTDHKIHTSLEDALDAVRRSIAAHEGERADEQASRDAQLLLERPDMPEAPPRTGPRKGRDRRTYDRDRHHWRQELFHKVDEEGAESTSDPHLHAAYDALLAGDREGFVRAIDAALYERFSEAVAERKLEIAMELIGDTAEEGDEEG